MELTTKTGLSDSTLYSCQARAVRWQPKRSVTSARLCVVVPVGGTCVSCTVVELFGVRFCDGPAARRHTHHIAGRVMDTEFQYTVLEWMTLNSSFRVQRVTLGPIRRLVLVLGFRCHFTAMTNMTVDR